MAGARDFVLVAAIDVVFELCFEMNLKTAGAKSVIENRKDNDAAIYIVGGVFCHQVDDRWYELCSYCCRRPSWLPLVGIEFCRFCEFLHIHDLQLRCKSTTCLL